MQPLPIQPAKSWIIFTQYSLLIELLAEVSLLSALAEHPSYLIHQCVITFYGELWKIRCITTTLIIFKTCSWTFLMILQQLQKSSFNQPSTTCWPGPKSSKRWIVDIISLTYLGQGGAVSPSIISRKNKWSTIWNCIYSYIFL